MAVKAGTAYVDIEGDFSALNRQVASHFKKIDQQAGKAGRGIGSKLGAGLATGVTAGAKIGAVGVAALGAEVFRATKGWSEHVALQRRSRAVIKSTGEAANVTAKHVERLADAVERQTGIDGDLIQNGANLLLTFTNIRNEVGKNNKIYDQAVKVTANMSKALGQDTKNSAIQLGKALNDPVKGITALSRVGVSFTEQQKKQIEALVDSGKTMEAQKIILKELNREFPKVKATPFERLVTVGRQVEDTIGKAVLPVFNKLVRNVTPGLQRIADKFDAILGDKELSAGQKLSKMFEAVKVEVDPLIDNIVESVRNAHLGEKLKKLAKDNAPEIAEGFKDVGGTVAGALWEGFKEAPLWAKVGGAGIAAKLLLGGGGGGAGGVGGKGGAFGAAGGLAAKAFKTAFEAGAVKLSTGSGITAKIATMFTGRGSTPANPLFVADITGGIGVGKPGGKGVPPVGLPGGKGGKGVGGFLSKLKGAAKFGGKVAAPLAVLDFGINLVDAKGNPIVAGVNTAHDLSFGIVPKLDPDAAGKRHLSEFQQELSKLASSGNIAGLKEMQAEFNKFTDFDAPGGIEKARKDIEDMIEVVRLADLGIHVEINSEEARIAAKQVSTALERMKTGSSRSVSSLKTNVRMNMRLIKRTLGEDSAAGKEAITANFNAAIANIRRSMEEGTISVKDGTALIETYMVKSMMNFGFTRKQALRYAKGQDPLTGKNISAPLVGKQRGGYVDMGAPSGDSVHAMLERDEYVLNRKAVKRIGKRALDRLNFGLAPRFQRGGSVTGDTDFLPALLRALRALSGDVGTPIYVQSGRRTVAEQLAQGPSTPAHPVAGPNGPHVRGVAADITPGYSVFGRAAARHGLAFTVMPQEPWHIQLVDTRLANLPNLPATAPTINAGTIVGPQSSLRNIAQGALNATAAGAQAAVTSAFNSLLPETGEPRAPTGTVTGNGSGMMKRIAADRGWSFADWWALDAKETGHGVNLSNPESSARLRGQFLSDNWGKYGPGSDPSQNPTMAQQIWSMAEYISERYGNPSKAWDWWMAHYPPGWYQRGGGVNVKKITKQIRKGFVPSKKAINQVVTAIGNTAKKGKIAGKGKVLRKRLLDRIKKIKLPAQWRELSGLENTVDKYDEWQAAAGTLTDTEEIRKALEDQQDALGRVLTDQEQDAIIKPLLGRVQGGAQYEWLEQELGALGSWRNALIRVRITLKDRIDKFTASIEAAVKRRKDLFDAIGKARRERDRLINQRKKAKKGSARYKTLTDQINKKTGRIRDWQAELDALVGPSGIIATLRGEKDVYTDALSAQSDSVESSLTDVQGSVAAGDKYRQIARLDPRPTGQLLGRIFDVQYALSTSGISSFRIPASDTGGGDTSDDPSKELLQELLRQANLRTAVSEAQFGVFRNLPSTFFPYGGAFAEGGTVPGPIGAPRMILAHGGEEVIANGDSNMPHVSLHFANGMEWLRQFVDVRVESQTRTQGRRGERQLPGRPGILR